MDAKLAANTPDMRSDSGVADPKPRRNVATRSACGSLHSKATRTPEARLHRSRPARHQRTCPAGAANRSNSLIERLSSGNAGLDQILDGGLLRNAISLFIGVPGSGKTILSQQYAFHNATVEHPALFLTTVTEPMDKVIRYGQTMKFFDPAAIRDRRVIYEDLGDILTKDRPNATSRVEFGEVLETLDSFLRELRPGIVVIDSFRAFHAFAKDENEFRLFRHGLIRRLTATATTTIWNAPYTHAQAQEVAEFAAADGVISPDIQRREGRELRVLQVLKLRGSGFLSDEHAYRISSAGLDVFPRLADHEDRSDYQLSTERVATGVPALDKMLGEGYWSGSSTLVCGPSGVGKTLTGLHFMLQGARSGQQGILATFQETENQLARIAAGFGWSLEDPGVNMLSRSVVDMYIDQWVYELLELVEKTGARRIVIDSLVDLMVTAGDPLRFREWMYSLVQHCARAVSA